MKQEFNLAELRDPAQLQDFQQQLSSVDLGHSLRVCGCIEGPMKNVKMQCCRGTMK